MTNAPPVSPGQAPPPASYETFLAAWDLLAPVGGLVSRDHDTQAAIWKQIAQDESRLWSDGKAAALVALNKVAGSWRLEANIWHSAGEPAAVATLLKSIEAWAGAIGCERVTLSGTPEWVSEFNDYTVRAVAGTKELRR